MHERGHSPDVQSNNPAYQAIVENQQLWNDTNPGLKYGHEIGIISRKIEKSLKRVFAGYIDPGYPQIVINFTAGYHPKAYDDEYTHTPFRFPKQIEEADRSDYMAGMFELNEWATAYATSYYWKTMEKNLVIKPLVRGYRSLNHNTMDIGSAPRATKVMEAVAKTAHLEHADFDHATLNALLKHNTAAMDHLISATPTLESTSLEELSIEMVRRPRKKIAEAVMGYGSQARENDSRIKSTAKHALISAVTHGWQAIPGIVEVNLAMGMAGPTLGGGLSATGNIELALTTGILGTAALLMPYPSTTIHEAIHGYSLSGIHNGIMPSTLEK